MTSFWLFLSNAFKWSFGFFEAFGNVLNWILFVAASVMFIYWCYMLVVTLGNNKDKEYYSPTEGKHPYYKKELHTEK